MTQPRETLVVTFFEHPCLAVRRNDGTIFLSIRDLCAAVGLTLGSQLRRLRADHDLRDGLHSFRVPTPGGPQDQEFLILEFVPSWISTVNRAKASPIVQERLRYLRLFSIRQVYDVIAHAAGLPEGTSRDIEDLHDLEQFDASIQGIAERQQALEESQAKARQAWHNHEEWILRLEAQLAQSTTLSPAQRGHIYQLVQLWAQARVDRENLPFGAAIAGCWAAIKTRFQVAKYEHMPSREYARCVTYIRQAYEKLVGEPLNGEQLTLFETDE